MLFGAEAPVVILQVFATLVDGAVEGRWSSKECTFVCNGSNSLPQEKRDINLK